MILAIHGERSRQESFVMVGGLWEGFRKRMRTEFQEAGFRVERPRDGLGGVNPENICNRGLSGMGGQLEISEALRERLRHDPIELHRFVHAVRRALFEAEAETGVEAETWSKPEKEAGADSQADWGVPVPPGEDRPCPTT
jgi:phage replication-related protein YjqB (UPF0714/DUF867 family)